MLAAGRVLRVRRGAGAGTLAAAAAAAAASASRAMSGGGRAVVQPPDMERRVPALVGKVADPYVPPLHADEYLPLLSAAGMQQRWTKLQKTLRSFIVLGQVRKELGASFTRESFQRDAVKVYIGLHAAFAKGDLNALRTVATEDVFLAMRSQIEERKASGQVVQWELIQPPSCTVLHMNVARVLSAEHMFAQITCLFESKQAMKVLTKDGKVVRSTPDRVTQDYWVLERYLSNPKFSRGWRYCAKLDNPWKDAAASAAQAS